MAPVLCSACRAGQNNFADTPKNGIEGHLGRTWQRRRLLHASLSAPGEAPDPQVPHFHTAAAVAKQAGHVVPCINRHA